MAKFVAHWFLVGAVLGAATVLLLTTSFDIL